MSDSFNLVVTALNNPAITSLTNLATVYPNPASPILLVKFREVPNTTLEIRLIASDGRSIQVVKTKEKLTTIPINNLPSGYHRDMQLTKEILFPALDELQACISMMKLMINAMQVKADILQDEKYKYLFSVEKVNELVNQGIPFRDAYTQVGNLIDQGKFEFDTSKALHHTHEGSIGNLCNDEIRIAMERVNNKFN
jgi:argininosuccinate lyase